MIALWLFAGLVLLFGFVVAFGAPYVPSLKKEVRNAFTTLYKVGPKDTVVDLGSGDGKVLTEVARLGAKGYGYELNPVLVLISKLRLHKRATIRLTDMWKAELPKSTTLVYVFSVSRDSRKLGRFIQMHATRQNRTIRVMTFGTGLIDFEPVAVLNAHRLYEIAPIKQ